MDSMFALIASGSVRVSRDSMWGLRVFMEEIENLLPGDATNLHTFVAPVFAALDSNSGFWGFQKIGEKSDQGFIGAAFNGRGAEPNFQRPTEGSGDFVFAGARLDADIKGQRAACRVFGNFQETHLSQDYQVSAYWALPGAFVLNRRLELRAEFLRRAPRPVGIAQQFPGEKDKIGLLGCQDRLDLRWVGQHAYRASGDVRLAANCCGKLDLVAGAQGNFHVGDQAAARYINQVHTETLETSA